MMSLARVFISALILALWMSGMAYAGEGVQRFVQGVIGSFDSNSFVLNESHRVNIAQETLYFDAHGRPSGIQVIAERRWVYVEGSVEPDGALTAEKVYALPGYINKKNRSKYEFMQLP